MLTDHVGAASPRGEVDSCPSASSNCSPEKNDFSKEVVDVRNTAEQLKLDKEIELVKLKIKLAELKREDDMPENEESKQKLQALFDEIKQKMKAESGRFGERAGTEVRRWGKQTEKIGHKIEKIFKNLI